MNEATDVGRPWAQGVGLLVLGLVLSGISNGVAQHAGPMSAARVLGTVGYVAGIVVAGAGVHRVLWSGKSPRPRWARVILTGLVTLPVFAAAAVLLGLLMMMFQARFAT
jgi:hypothetical protein